MVKTISELTVSNLTLSKYLGISNTKLNQICQIGMFSAEASPGRGKKRALTFADVLTLRITVELRRIVGQELGKDRELLDAAKKLSRILVAGFEYNNNVDWAGIVQFSNEDTTVITNAPSDWLSPQDENSVDINKYLKSPYYSVSFFLLRPLFEEIEVFFKIVKEHRKEEKSRLKKETETKP